MIPMQCRRWWCGGVVAACVCVSVCLATAGEPAKAPVPSPPAAPAAPETPQQVRLRGELAKLPYRIVYESLRGKDWEIMLMNADGTGGKNLTNAPDADDLYPHASPDGTKVCFVADEGAGKERARSVYVMNIDGTGRKLVARHGREPCWGPDSKKIAYLHSEFERFTTKDFATKGLAIVDLESGATREHPNDKLFHLYNLCWSPCGKWFTATVHGGMGHKHADLAIEAEGQGVFPLPGVGGCRPDISLDGKHLCWNMSDQVIAVADLDLTVTPPTVQNIRRPITTDKEHKVYHSDWSPDGKYITFSYGPKQGEEQMGEHAAGWHICVADAAETNVWVVLTRDGDGNKEPDWVPASEGKGK